MSFSHSFAFSEKYKKISGYNKCWEKIGSRDGAGFICGCSLSGRETIFVCASLVVLALSNRRRISFDPTKR